jgi:WD40 repeat protein
MSSRKGDPIRQDAWPASGPRRDWLVFCDRIHRVNGTLSRGAIAEAMNLKSRTRVNDMLRGLSPPADEDQARKLLEALGAVADEVDRGVVLYNKAHAEWDAPQVAGVVDRAALRELVRRNNGHFDTRGRGVHNTADRGDYFIGRTVALSELASWLRAADHDRKAYVVTGNPGSGKSALLGRLLRLTEPGVDIVPLQAHRATVEVLVRDLATVVGHPDATPDELLTALADRTTPIAVIVDALNEAGTAGDSTESSRIARELLKPLTTVLGLRLIIGTRRPLIPALGRAVNVIDLDDVRYIQAGAVLDYAQAVLLDAQDPASLSPYRHEEALAARIAGAIAKPAGTSFLVARLNARALVDGQIIVDTARPDWQNHLPTDAHDAYGAYLGWFGSQQAKVERLLRALAYALGIGLPATLWPTLGRALSGVPCTTDDVRWVLAHASSYVEPTETAHGPVYRLFHETMLDHLRAAEDDAGAHRAITNALLDEVLLDPVKGERRWLSAHSYVRDQLATHAAAGGVIDALVSDIGFLVHSDPDALLIALHQVQSDDARLTSAVYRASAGTHRRLEPERRRQMLAMDAARLGATDHHRRLAADVDWPTQWATGQQVSLALHATFADHAGEVRAVACTTIDNRPVTVTAGDDGSIRVWNLTTGAPIVSLHGKPVRAIACSVVDEDPIAVVVAADGTVQVWDLRSGAPGAMLAEGALAVACTEVDGRPVAVACGEDAAVRVWDLPAGTPRAELAGHRGRVSAVATSAVDGEPVAVTAGQDGTVRVWNLRTGRLRITIDAPHVTAIACTRYRGRAVIITVSDVVMMWDLASGIGHTTRPDYTGWINAVACTTINNRTIIVLGGDDGVVRLWDPADSELRTVLAGHHSWINAVACPDETTRPMAITASNDRTAQTWDLTIAIDQRLAVGHTGDIFAVTAGMLDGRAVAVTVSRDKTGRIWDLHSGALHATLSGHDGEVDDVAFTCVKGRATVVTTGTDRTVRVWDASSGRLTHTLTGHDGFIHLVACRSIAGRDVAITTSSDRTVRVWDLESGDLIRVLPTGEDHTGLTRCADVDGTPILLTTDLTRPIQLWDLTSGEVVGTLDGSPRVTALSCSTIGGQSVAIAADHHGAVSVWDLESQSRRFVLSDEIEAPADLDAVSCITCTILDSRPVALLGRHSGLLSMWHLDTGTRRNTLTGHNRRVVGISCSTLDNRRAAISIARDRTARVWELDTARQSAVIDFPAQISHALWVESAQQLLVTSGWDIAVLKRKS